MEGKIWKTEMTQFQFQYKNLKKNEKNLLFFTYKKKITDHLWIKDLLNFTWGEKKPQN